MHAIAVFWPMRHSIDGPRCHREFCTPGNVFALATSHLSTDPRTPLPLTAVHCRSTVPRSVLCRFQAPHDGFVAEAVTDSNHFTLAEGPFAQWDRHLAVTPGPTDDTVTIDETVTFKIAAPIWHWLFVYPVKRRIRRTHHHFGHGGSGSPIDEHPFWLPPDRLDTRATTVLATLVTLSMIVGYLGTVITQTITFAADEFGASTGDQGTVLAAVRVGVLLSLVVVMLADRRGRRTLLLGSVAVSCVVTAASALATDLAMLGVLQTIARAFSTSVVVLLAVVAAEEMPASSRAYAIGVMTLSAGLGAGVCVWFLPLADTSPQGWRWLYVIPLAALPLVRFAARHLTESRRFIATTTRVTTARLSNHWRKVVLLGTALFAAAAFAAPASQFQNDFLKNERSFSAARISLFTLLTSTPGGVGIVIGGYLADVRGRRVVGAIGTVGGALCTALAFSMSGWPMWMWSILGTVMAGMAVPALAVYGPELFPTALRSKANGALQAMAVAGSSVGLLVVGTLVDRWDAMGSAMSVMLIAPMLVAFLVIVAYPETAHLELEAINPEDEIEPETRSFSAGPLRRPPQESK